MDIVFEAYDDQSGDGQLTLPIGVGGGDTVNFARMRQPLATHGEGVQQGAGTGAVRTELLRILASSQTDVGGMSLPLGVQGYASSLAPTIGVGSIGPLPLDVHGTGTSTSYGDGSMSLPVSVFGSNGSGVGRMRSPLYVFGREQAVSRVATLYQLPTVQSYGSVGITLGLSDSFMGTETHSSDVVHALMDLIQCSSTYSSMAEVVQALADGMSLADIAQFIWEAGLTDAFVASGVLEGQAQITVMLADGVKVDDAANAITEILAALHDGFYASLTLRGGDDDYSAWVMTPETKAMRSYSNFPFNSYATVGGQFIGINEKGIYRFGGATDDGVAIRSSIRTGLMQFGDQSMSAVNTAYVGTTTSGALLLRVQATTVKGQRIEQTYRGIPSVADDARAMRIKVGRGFRSVYWIFELCNDVDGAEFEVHDWHVLPVSLTGKLI